MGMLLKWPRCYNIHGLESVFEEPQWELCHNIFIYFYYYYFIESELAWKGKVNFPFFGWASTETLIAWNKGIKGSGIKKERKGDKERKEGRENCCL